MWREETIFFFGGEISSYCWPLFAPTSTECHLRPFRLHSVVLHPIPSTDSHLSVADVTKVLTALMAQYCCANKLVHSGFAEKIVHQQYTLCIHILPLIAVICVHIICLRHTVSYSNSNGRASFVLTVLCVDQHIKNDQNIEIKHHQVIEAICCLHCAQQGWHPHVWAKIKTSW